MILLASTTDLLSLVTSAAASVDVVASYVDNASGTITPAAQGTAIVTATTTTIVGAPAASTQRNVKNLNIRNKHATTACTVTVQQAVGATTYELFKVTLLAGYEACFIEGDGWEVYDTNGAPVAQSLVPMTRQVLTAGTAATYTTPARCRAIDVFCLGGGGAGGGAPTATSSGAMGGGGGSGGYSEKLIAAPAATFTYTIGAAGTGSSGTTGGAGGDSTFAGSGITTITGKGGSGGGFMAAAATAAYSAGGAGGIAGSGGDFNTPGGPGAPGMRATAALGASGNGANSMLGAGALGLFNAQGTGNAAVANTGGGGGGGSCISAGSAVAGGAGGSGIIVVTEFY